DRSHCGFEAIVILNIGTQPLQRRGSLAEAGAVGGPRCDRPAPGRGPSGSRWVASLSQTELNGGKRCSHLSERSGAPASTSRPPPRRRRLPANSIPSSSQTRPDGCAEQGRGGSPNTTPSTAGEPGRPSPSDPL